MNKVRKHWIKTKTLVEKVDSKKIAEWLLSAGYYPEQYVFPPCFRAENFELKIHPYKRAIINNEGKFNPKLDSHSLIDISFPKTDLTDRIFGIYHPEIYHDIIWYLDKHWNQVRNHLFNTKNKVCSYSFPIPITSEKTGEIGPLRAGRMIYEYLELMEKDLLNESYKYEYLLKTDIKNFYSSIYTHAIPWAIHGKDKFSHLNRKNWHNFRYAGNILDKLIQYGNNAKTNGIPVGPAISDLIAEIILTAVDINFSKSFKRNDDIVAARYKDDYFFLVKDKSEVEKILKCLQSVFKEFNLFLNEEKTDTYTLPQGLMRPWIQDYNKTFHGLMSDGANRISFRDFLTLAQEVIRIDSEYPGTGLIDKFLSRLTVKNEGYSLAIDFKSKANKERDVFKVYSFVLHMAKKNMKSFPNALGVIESILRSPESIMPKNIKDKLIVEMKSLNAIIIDSNDEHQKLWWLYFVLSNESVKGKISVKEIYQSHKKSGFINSFKKGKQCFFSDFKDADFFVKPVQDNEYPIARHLDIFCKSE